MAAAIFAGSRLGGPHGGGTIFAHDASLAYSLGDDALSPCDAGVAPPSCENADTRLDGSDPDHPSVWKVYAAFPPASSPRLKALCWGVHYEDNLVITAWGACIGNLYSGGAELPGACWPATDTGTSMVFETTQTGLLTQCYWFAGYRYGGSPCVFQLRDHPDPVLGGKFADDSVPAALDPIAGYGSLGFDTNGTAACPQTAPSAASVGRGQGVILPSPLPHPCSAATLCRHFDGTAENGYGWQHRGCVAPSYGAFAECFDFGIGSCLCGIELMLTSLGGVCSPADLYIWADAGGRPGNVLAMTSGANPGPVATWPNVSTHDLPMVATQVAGVAWFGYRTDYSNAPCGYFIAADTNGFGGCPYTNIAPGLGYATGWNHVSAVWGPTRSLGIGAWRTADGCGGVSVRESTWGRIKQLYR
jgi:hypothetical protein